MDLTLILPLKAATPSILALGPSGGLAGRLPTQSGCVGRTVNRSSRRERPDPAPCPVRPHPLFCQAPPLDLTGPASRLPALCHATSRKKSPLRGNEESNPTKPFLPEMGYFLNGRSTDMKEIFYSKYFKIKT